MTRVASAMGGARATGDDWRDCYQTPRGVVDHVHRVLGSIMLDAAASSDNALGPAYCGADHDDHRFRDALSCDWMQAVSEQTDRPFREHDPKVVAFCNPPFSMLSEFSRKCAAEGQRMTVGLLCMVRMEVEWWREWVQPYASEVITYHPRVNYVDPRTGEPSSSGSPAAPSCLIVYRPALVGPPRYTHAKWYPGVKRCRYTLPLFGPQPKQPDLLGDA